MSSTRPPPLLLLLLLLLLLPPFCVPSLPPVSPSSNSSFADLKINSNHDVTILDDALLNDPADAFKATMRGGAQAEGDNSKERKKGKGSKKTKRRRRSSSSTTSSSTSSSSSSSSLVPSPQNPTNKNNPQTPSPTTTLKTNPPPKQSNTPPSSSPYPKPQTSSPYDAKITLNLPSYGKLIGRRSAGVDRFLGIPYAAPPVGLRRFSPPEPAQPWAPKKLDASDFSPDCWQTSDPVLNPRLGNGMSEDCLYLNVYTPAGHASRTKQGRLLSGKRLLPVMLWFHGGGFQQGGANRAEYDGTQLSEKDVIVVTINYRLGALGFLVSIEDGLYGNYGLMDQRAALEFVHKNIRYFGGDPDQVTLFGESAGAVMIGLHLMMDGAGEGGLFQKAVMQSNPLGYSFRSVIVADFIGKGLKREVDCRDLECLRAERVEEIVNAQGGLMGVPRSVGDFFVWGPTLTKEVKYAMRFSSTDPNNPSKFLPGPLSNTDSPQSPNQHQQEQQLITKMEGHRVYKFDTNNRQQKLIDAGLLSNKNSKKDSDDPTLISSSARWANVNVSQPLSNHFTIPDNVPIIIGTNAHEGQMFVYSAFPAPMPKVVYWMFVGALFRDSAPRVLNHYRDLVLKVEEAASKLGERNLREEEAKQDYLDRREELEKEYEDILQKASLDAEASSNSAPKNPSYFTKLWRGGAAELGNETAPEISETPLTRAEKALLRQKRRLERNLAKQKARALKEAAKVAVDYRPVMSTIIDDYLFRCPSWKLASQLTGQRASYFAQNTSASSTSNSTNVYVYRFSQPTHVAGYPECWGLACHTAEMPYIFNSIPIIMEEYSVRGLSARNEAPVPLEYPYTEAMAAFQGVDLFKNGSGPSSKNSPNASSVHSKMDRVFNQFFGEFFHEDADEELATDLSERWAAFAKTSDPNHDGSKVKWGSWLPNKASMPTQTDEEQQSMFESTDGEYDYYDTDEEFYDGFQTEFDETDTNYGSGAGSDYNNIDELDLIWGEEESEDEFRSRVLMLLGVETARDTKHRTELRRSNSPYEKEEFSSWNIFKKRKKREEDKKSNEKDHYFNKYDVESRANFILKIAQAAGVMGSGIDAEGDESEAEWLNEIIDFSWPPEARLIESDCTCEMWNRIRYKY
ncbi:hypothetical protein TrVE_jg14387 [Triparma verrucosa]|uniref:Carboxylesterase type B domain-containing protein n=1 Tax=Triparma verrucosa TaxID=1606542 RepID=A0A9W7FA45_9STRA|nr:hypothetical protein TrVE_jg14387 [Triparma verrucosa]